MTVSAVYQTPAGRDNAELLGAPGARFVLARGSEMLSTGTAAARARCKAEYFRAMADFEDAEARRLEAVERNDAVVAALAHFDGPLTTRAAALAFDLDRYLSTAWLRERDLERLPPATSSKRRALHRIARSRDGEGIKMRQIFNIGRNATSRT